MLSDNIQKKERPQAAQTYHTCNSSVKNRKTLFFNLTPDVGRAFFEDKKHMAILSDNIQKKEKTTSGPNVSYMMRPLSPNCGARNSRFIQRGPSISGHTCVFQNVLTGTGHQRLKSVHLFFVRSGNPHGQSCVRIHSVEAEHGLGFLLLRAGDAVLEWLTLGSRGRRGDRMYGLQLALQPYVVWVVDSRAGWCWTKADVPHWWTLDT